MVLQPKKSTGEPGNEHPRSEQWLLVTSGTGRARVNDRYIKLRPGRLLVIQKGEIHRIENTGRTPLRTINLYVPPAYDANGEVKKDARSPKK